MWKYSIDNNVISNYFSEDFSKAALDFSGKVMDEIPNVSVITEIKVLSWVNNDKNKEKIIENFINDANVLTISPAIVKHCILINRKTKIKTPDAIIAATAMVNRMTVISSDSDSSKIFGLSLIDPFDID